MTGKTKAAMPGRLSLNALLKHRQITRLAAGGQTLSQRNPYVQINRVRLTYGHHNPLKELDYNESLESAGNKHEQYSGSPEHQHCLGSEVPTNNVESCEDNQPSLRGEPLHNSLKVAQNRPFLRGAVHSITESNPAQPFGSMPCRRNSARASSFNQLPRLTPSRSAASLSCCRNSGVIRIWKVGDSPSPFGVLSRLIVDMYVRNLIAWILLCTYVITTNMQKTTPRTAGTVPGRLTSTDKLRIEEAMKDHITHPQGRKSYIWRFLALSAIGRNVIHITATTEREAREQSPAGCVMVFAGRLPVQEVRYA